MITREPFVFFLNDPRTAELAKAKGETRSNAALSLWKRRSCGSVVLIVNATNGLISLVGNEIEKGRA